MGKLSKYFIIAALAVPAAVSCRTDDIKPYDTEDSAVVFASTSTSFSLKGVTDEEVTFYVPITLVGPTADYDRRIDVEVVYNDDANAVEGSDFVIEQSCIAAGGLSGSIPLLVKNNLTAEEPHKQITLSLVPNEYFRAGYPAYSSSVVSWSEEYVRPNLEVWRYWYLYFSKYYSRAYHELLVQEFGEEIEHVTNSQSYAASDTTLVYKLPTWWYAATRQFRQSVADYDAAHPDSPLMHSEDCMYYTSYLTADGAGETPDEIPTIYETLNVL